MEQSRKLIEQFFSEKSSIPNLNKFKNIRLDDLEAIIELVASANEYKLLFAKVINNKFPDKDLTSVIELISFFYALCLYYDEYVHGLRFALKTLEELIWPEGHAPIKNKPNLKVVR